MARFRRNKRQSDLVDHQRHTLATTMRCFVARRAHQIRKLKIIDHRSRRQSESRVWKIVAMMLAKFMADIGH